MNSSAVMVLENMPKVPSMAAFWPSSLVAAQQSDRVITLNPIVGRAHCRFDAAVGEAADRDHLVPPVTSCASRSVPGNPSSLLAEHDNACLRRHLFAEIPFQVPAVKAVPPPARQDAQALVGVVGGVLAEADGLVKDLGACFSSGGTDPTVLSACWSFHDRSHAPWSLPPSVLNSFWYSMQSTAVFEGIVVSLAMV